MEWGCSDSESLRVKAIKKSMFTRRSSRSLNEENSATESKVASITNSPRDWRTVSYTSHHGDEGKDKDRDRERDTKDRHRKAKEVRKMVYIYNTFHIKPTLDTLFIFFWLF